jgi:hypothetical protein
MSSTAILHSVLLGGAFIGVLSALPLVSMANCCCCLWVVLGGALAAYALQWNTSVPIRPGQGAFAGFLAGIVGAIVGFVVGLVLAPVVGPLLEGLIERAQQGAHNLPPEFQDALGNLRVPGGSGALAIQVAGLLVNLVVYAVFGTLGGLLGALMVEKPAPPAAPPWAGSPPPPPPAAWTPGPPELPPGGSVTP